MTKWQLYLIVVIDVISTFQEGAASMLLKEEASSTTEANVVSTTPEAAFSTAEANVIPTFREAAVGSSAVYHCVSQTFVKWSFEDERIPANAFMYRNYLIITEITLDNEGFYECSGIDINGMYFDQVVELIVRVEDNSRVSPTEHVTAVGKTVKFSCDSIYLPGSSYRKSTRWLYNFGPLPENSHVGPDNSLLIMVVQLYNEGLYECRGHSENKIYFSAVARLTIESLEGVSPKVQSIILEGTATIECASDSPGKWRFVPLRNILKYDRDPFTPGNLLTITEFSQRKEGFYECTGTRNGIKFKDKGLVRLLISDEDRIFPKVAKVEEGKKAKFKCISTTMVEWYWNGRAAPEMFIHANTLTIKKTVVKHSGIIQCHGQTALRKHFTATAILAVYTRENDRIEPPQIELPEGEEGLFACESSIEPQWLYNERHDRKLPEGVKVIATGDLLIKGINKNVAGEYECQGGTKEGDLFIATGRVVVEEDSAIDRSAYDEENVPANDNVMTLSNENIPSKNIPSNLGSLNNIQYISGNKNIPGHENFRYGITNDDERVHPPFQSVESDTDAYFLCSSTGPVRWKMKHEDVLPLNAQSLTNNKLLIKEVVKVSEGKYLCYGTREDGSEFVADGELEVQEPTEPEESDYDFFAQEGLVSRTELGERSSDLVAQREPKISRSLPGTRDLLELLTPQVQQPRNQEENVNRLMEAKQHALEGVPLEQTDNDRMNPQSQSVKSSRDAYFSCSSTTPVRWMKKNDVLPLEALVLENNKLWIKQAFKVSEGVYLCYGTREDGSEFVAQGKLEVQRPTEAEEGESDSAGPVIPDVPGTKQLRGYDSVMVAEKLTDAFSDEFSDELPDDLSDDHSEDLSDDHSEDLSGDHSEDLSDDHSEDLSDDLPEDLSDELLGFTSAGELEAKRLMKQRETPSEQLMHQLEAERLMQQWKNPSERFAQQWEAPSKRTDHERMNPQSQSVKSSMDAYFSCASTTPVRWMKHNGILPLKAVVLENNKLWIKKAVQRSEGIYLCYGTREDGSEFVAEGKLEVQGPTEVENDLNLVQQGEQEIQWPSQQVVAPLQQTNLNNGKSEAVLNVEENQRRMYDLKMQENLKNLMKQFDSQSWCPTLPGIENGETHATSNGTYYSCHSNYVLVGSPVRHCLEDTKTWSGMQPKCTNKTSKFSNLNGHFISNVCGIFIMYFERFI